MTGTCENALIDFLLCGVCSAMISCLCGGPLKDKRINWSGVVSPNTPREVFLKVSCQYDLLVGTRRPILCDSKTGSLFYGQSRTNKILIY